MLYFVLFENSANICMCKIACRKALTSVLFGQRINLQHTLKILSWQSDLANKNSNFSFWHANGKYPFLPSEHSYLAKWWNLPAVACFYCRLSCCLYILVGCDGIGALFTKWPLKNATGNKNGSLPVISYDMLGGCRIKLFAKIQQMRPKWFNIQVMFYFLDTAVVALFVQVYSVCPLQLAGRFDVLDGSNGSCGQGSWGCFLRI